MQILGLFSLFQASKLWVKRKLEKTTHAPPEAIIQFYFIRGSSAKKRVDSKLSPDKYF